MTAFGQTCFGHLYLAEFGQTEFGQCHIWPKLTDRIWPTLFGRIWPIFVDRIWPDRIWPIFCFGGPPRGGGPKSGGPKGWGPLGVGAPKGWGPEPRKSGARRVGARNFALFFSLSPTGKFILSSLSGGFLVEFWWCLKRRDAQMCAFGVLWLSCGTPAAPPDRAAGVPHDNQRTPNVHI